MPHPFVEQVKEAVLYALVVCGDADATIELGHFGNDTTREAITKLRAVKAALSAPEFDVGPLVEAYLKSVPGSPIQAVVDAGRGVLRWYAESDPFSGRPLPPAVKALVDALSAYDMDEPAGHADNSYVVEADDPAEQKRLKDEREAREARYAKARAADALNDAENSTGYKEEFECLARAVAEKMSDDELDADAEHLERMLAGEEDDEDDGRTEYTPGNADPKKCRHRRRGPNGGCLDCGDPPL